MRYLNEIPTKELLIALFECDINNIKEDYLFAKDIIKEFDYRNMSELFVLEMGLNMGLTLK